MIAQDGEGRRIQAPELFGIAALQDRPQMKVHDIAPEEDKVRTLGIDQVDPAGELRPAVPIPQVQVARQDEGQGLVQRLLRGDGHPLAVLVPVVDPARHQDGGDEARHEHLGRPPARGDPPQMPRHVNQRGKESKDKDGETDSHN